MYETTTREHLVGVAPLDTGRATASRTEHSERQTNDPLHPSCDHMATTRKLNSGKSMTTNKLKTYAAATIINEWHTRLASLNDRTNLGITASESLPPGANQDCNCAAASNTTIAFADFGKTRYEDEVVNIEWLNDDASD